MDLNAITDSDPVVQHDPRVEPTPAPDLHRCPDADAGTENRPGADPRSRADDHAGTDVDDTFELDRIVDDRTRVDPRLGDARCRVKVARDARERVVGIGDDDLRPVEREVLADERIDVAMARDPSDPELRAIEVGARGPFAERVLVAWRQEVDPSPRERPDTGAGGGDPG